ncbi:MAG: DUF6965 family protein [Luteibaculaceae bacterium]
MQPKYILDPSSKKFTCPACNEKTFVRYIEVETKAYLPEQIGRCDRENNCKYHVLPPLETLCYFVPCDEVKIISDKAIVLKQGKHEAVIPKKAVFEQLTAGAYIAEYFLKDTSGKRTEPLKISFVESDSKSFQSERNTVQSYTAKPPKKPQPENLIPFDFETFKTTLTSYEKNVFIQNLLTNVKHPFASDEVTKVIQLYRLGTITNGHRTGAICFPFIDLNGLIRTVQVKQFDKTNHTTGTDFLHSMIEKEYTKKNEPLPNWLDAYKKQNKKVSCLFGEHLLSKYPLNPVALVEAPKTAVYGTLYFGEPQRPGDFIWLAVYNKSSFSFDKLQVLQGRKVVIFPDLSKDGSTFNEWKIKAKEFESNLPSTSFVFSDLLEKFATPEQRAKGSDIADILINYSWQTFRKQPKQAEPKPVPVKTIFAPAKPQPKKVVNTDWANSILELENYFNAIELPKRIVLDKCSVITEPKKLIQSHLSTVKANKGNLAYLPYLERLNSLKTILG